MLATLLIICLSTVWVSTYASFGLWVSAATPFAYQLISVLALVDFARSHRFERFRAVELAMMLVLPFLLHGSLGGFIASSGVAMWALVAPLGALILLGVRGALGRPLPIPEFHGNDRAWTPAELPSMRVSRTLPE